MESVSNIMHEEKLYMAETIKFNIVFMHFLKTELEATLLI
jgi:hypothetical protein